MQRESLEISQPVLNEAATQQLVASRSLLFTLTSLVEMKDVAPGRSSAEFMGSSAKRRPFDYMAYLELRTIGNGPVRPQHLHSFSLLQHRLTILISLGSLLHEGNPNSEEKTVKLRYFSHALETLVRLVAKGHATTHLGDTETVWKGLLPKLMRELDLECEMLDRFTE